MAEPEYPTPIRDGWCVVREWTAVGAAEDRGDGNFEFIIPDSADYPQRFYRIVTP